MKADLVNPKRHIMAKGKHEALQVRMYSTVRTARRNFKAAIFVKLVFSFLICEGQGNPGMSASKGVIRVFLLLTFRPPTEFGRVSTPRGRPEGFCNQAM